MSKVICAHSMSLDGFIAGAGDGPGQPLGRGGQRLFQWFSDGDTPSRFYPWMKMSAASAAAFDEGAGSVGAVVTGRRTYEISNAWQGDGPLPGVPLVVLTHSVPDTVPSGSSHYTFVTEGIERAVEVAREAAGSKNVSLMGTSIVQQALRAGLLDELTVSVVPVLLGRGARLLDGIEVGTTTLEVIRVVDAPGVTHLTYRVSYQS
jgi:dihydrofolate reductase